MKNIKKQDLIDLTLYEILRDIENKDLTAIEELISKIPIQNLIAFLPENVSDDDIKSKLNLIREDTFNSKI